MKSGICQVAMPNCNPDCRDSPVDRPPGEAEYEMLLHSSSDAQQNLAVFIYIYIYIYTHHRALAYKKYESGWCIPSIGVSANWPQI